VLSADPEQAEGMIHITPHIAIDEGEIHQEFIRASGPGGQKVNKVATAVQLRFDVGNSPGLPEDVRERLIFLAGRRINNDGVLIIEARRFRTQDRNRQDAMERLIQLVRRAAEKQKPRHKTRPTPASRRRRLEAKRQRGETKRLRQSVSGSDG
jgi:ribosome-associated protein